MKNKDVIIKYLFIKNASEIYAPKYLISHIQPLNIDLN